MWGRLKLGKWFGRVFREDLRGEVALELGAVTSRRRRQIWRETTQEAGSAGARAQKQELAGPSEQEGGWGWRRGSLGWVLRSEQSSSREQSTGKGGWWAVQGR